MGALLQRIVVYCSVRSAYRKERVCDEIDARGEPADLLIVITPGVERFEYFRHLEREHVRTRDNVGDRLRQDTDRLTDR